jgi:hypothetical protein
MPKWQATNDWDTQLAKPFVEHIFDGLAVLSLFSFSFPCPSAGFGHLPVDAVSIDAYANAGHFGEQTRVQQMSEHAVKSVWGLVDILQD